MTIELTEAEAKGLLVVFNSSCHQWGLDAAFVVTEVAKRIKDALPPEATTEAAPEGT